MLFDVWFPEDDLN